MGKEQRQLEERSIKLTEILRRCQKYEKREAEKAPRLSDEESLDRTAPPPKNNQPRQGQEVIDFDEPAAGSNAVSGEESRE